MKKAVLFLLVLVAIPLNGQLSVESDTIFIGEVMITGNRLTGHYSGSRSASIDSSVISEYNGNSLADLIGDNSSVHIKSYGPGNLASPSCRGTTAGHTGVAWNNINIESPMTGQSDLSIIPAGMADDINIFYGGNSMSISGGSAGGLINLETKPDWGEKGLLMLNPAAGCFGRKSLLVKARTGTADFQSVTKAFLFGAENDFPYLNSISGDAPVTEIRENNQVSQEGFIQELYYRKSHHELSARFWYQSAARKLPVPIIVPSLNPPETQNDMSFRSMLAYDYQLNKTSLNLTSAFISDRLDYKNEQASVDSRNSLKRIILKGTFNSMISNILNLRLAADNELALVETNNYDCRKSRNVLSFDAAADLNIMRWLSANLLLRETIQDDRFLAPDFSAGADIKPFGTKENFIKLNFAKNSRIATLNDLYWSPGGNPDLRNESGYIAEITLDLSTTVAGSVKIGTDLTFYHNRISDLIQWRPGEYSYWQADNVDDLVSKGMEANINIMFHGPSYNFKMMSGYTHIISGSNGKESTGSSGRRLQLIYVPADMFNTFIRAEWKKFYSTVRFNYTGKRFVDADNTIYLSPYTVTDLDAGIKLTLKKTLTDIRMGVENIFNIDYQNIAYYPMPRRNFTASVLFQIKK
ncbi:MAG TPA: TonB-dependent receptor plug domain-containing protein [Bacteroidales bacterium]|nr:TonB-dependent receptor plug domain-containing protein [Bacteroidales bacterium]